MKVSTLISLCLFPVFLHAQISLNEWTTGKPVTDSSHHNRNACLAGQNYNNLIFWDQEINATTTRICYKNLNDQTSETKIALEQTGVQNTHPKILELSTTGPDNDYLVIYQTNDGGNGIDLKYMIYYGDGTFSAPAILSALPGDDINLCIYGSTIAWENNGKIFLSLYEQQNEMFGDPVLVETNGGYSPAFSNNWLQYLVKDGDNTLLKAKCYYWNQGTWQITDSASNTIAGICSGLNCNISWMGNNLCMQQEVTNQKSGIVISDYEFTPYTLRSENYNYTEPAICDYMIGVKYDMLMYFLAYVSDSLSQPDIFAINPLMYNGPVNISQWPGNDRHPGIFVTFPQMPVVRVNLFWESDREGFSTIYYSFYDYIFGSINENPKAESISVSPCPFSRETKLKVQTPGNCTCKIFDMQGRLVKSLKLKYESAEWQTAVWDGTDNKGIQAGKGSYVVVVNSAQGTQSRIIIKE
jgi:hypothetical protein